VIVFDRPEEIRAWSAAERANERRVAFVPTMGALHAGHAALVDRARDLADLVVVSIFVNPLQFDRPDDLASYPRVLDEDLALCAAHGVAAVYAPTAATMYPPGHSTRVVPGPEATRMEGERRPGHFEGVTTVVLKLLHAVEPDVAVFGEKDYQQLAVLRTMVRDLDVGVEVVGVPTVREPDGLAMSSRNRRLDPAARRAARCVPDALEAGRATARLVGATTADVTAAVHAVLEREPAASVDYVEVFDGDDLAPVERPVPGSRLAVAVWLDGVRLIDNVALDG
jgi:pantoate--beta-alanine ligase